MSNEDKMLKRTITLIVAIAMLLPIVIFADIVPIPYIVYFGLAALIMVYEISGCFGVRKQFIVTIPSYLFAAAAVTLSSLFFVGVIKNMTLLITVLLAAGAFYLFFIFSAAMLSNGAVRFAQVGELAAYTIYMLTGVLSIIFLRFRPNGQYNIWLVFLGAWVTDTFAYLVGRAIGKHKLIPSVSPHKTVEGAIGAVFGCIIGYMLLGLGLQIFAGKTVNYIFLLILALIISVVDQLGDLIASYVKREANVKDFGFIFPGHGGVMDRADSLISNAIFIIFILYFTQMETLVFI